MLKKSLGVAGLATVLACIPFTLIKVSNKYVFTHEIAKKPKAVRVDCGNQNPTPYESTIENNTILPVVIHAHLCDKITVLNKDNVVRRIAFGKHEQHIIYDGIEETLLAKGKSFTFVLNQTGTFLYHDHEDESVKAEFVVD